MYKNLLNLGCQDIICFSFFKLLKNEESFWKNFSFSFSAKCFDRNFKCFCSCILPFLNAMRFDDSNRFKRHLVSRFACNIRVIVYASLTQPISCVKLLSQKPSRIKPSSKETKYNVTSSINQMVIR